MRRAELDQQIAVVNKSWQARLDQAGQRVSEAQTAERDKSLGTEERRKRLVDIGTELTKLEAKRIDFAARDQVRRIAALVFGIKPEEATESQTAFVTLLWFGSLAALAALAGPIAAMVALGLQSIAEHGSNSRSGPLAATLRRILITWRWRRVRTVKIKIEVPVEKPETIIKEIIYVPILTDNPEAVRQALANTPTGEMAEVVKFTAKKG